MDFLLNWLLKHQDVEVRIKGVEDHDGKYIHVSMICENGQKIARYIGSIAFDHSRVIFDSMYNELIREGGSV